MSRAVASFLELMPRVDRGIAARLRGCRELLSVRRRSRTRVRSAMKRVWPLCRATRIRSPRLSQRNVWERSKRGRTLRDANARGSEIRPLLVWCKSRVGLLSISSGNVRAPLWLLPRHLDGSRATPLQPSDGDDDRQQQQHPLSTSTSTSASRTRANSQAEPDLPRRIAYKFE